MGLFTKDQISKINQVAEKSKEIAEFHPTGSGTKAKGITSEVAEMSQKVIDYFQDSEAILISTVDQLHEYVTKLIDSGICSLDTETTGLDRVKDYIVGASLYYPGGVECYIPMKHRVPIFDELCKGQLTYEDVGREFQRIVDAGIKTVFANADFDLAMVYKDLKADFNDVCYYDVILAWRCLKEDERDNALKVLYNKYVLKGQGDPMKFNDFFTPQLFPYCKPEVAKLYAAHDAKITYELYEWQLPYITKSHPKCKKNHLEAIADLIWNVEFPLIKVCQNMHRAGVFLDKEIASTLVIKYDGELTKEKEKLSEMVDDVLEKSSYHPSPMQKVPFRTGKDFVPTSPMHVKHLIYTVMGLPQGKGSTGKDVLAELNYPVTNQILKVRSLNTLISTFVEKLPKATTPDSRIHCQFKQIGADCVVGNTIVPTKDGYYLASDLCSASEASPGHHVDVYDLEIVNKDQQHESASSVICYKGYDTIRITTDMGFVLEGTPNHPIMVSNYTKSDGEVLRKNIDHIWDNRYFKTLDQVRVGDIVEIPCNYPTGGSYQPTNLTLGRIYNNRNEEATIPEVYDESFAEFLGMYHADGSSAFREGTYTISLSNDDEDVISRFDYLTSKLFNVSTSRYDKQKDIHEVESYINCMRIGSIDSILSHGKQNKRIPRAIWISPASVINAYIKGLTLDSSVYYEKSTGRAELELSIINEDDARLVQLHLASQGILSSWGTNENKNFKSPRLKFNSDNYILFRDIIGFIESRKVVQTKGCVKNPYRTRRIGNSFRLFVKKIEYNVNDVYDLHVPGTHSFISNGMISHNTGRMSSQSPNMQNIPSHATDIRHMFHATPARFENINCTDVNTFINVELPNVCLVETQNGEKEAQQLVKDDVVKLLHDNQEVWCLVVENHIVNIDGKLRCKLVFSV